MQIYDVPFTPAEREQFLNSPIIGAPLRDLSNYDAQYMDWKTPISRPGIPYNSSDNSELYNWIREARKADLALSGKALRIVIKADKDAKYSVVKQVIKTLEKQKLRRFSLMTGTSEHVI